MSMKEVFFKGEPYQYKVINMDGKRQFQLYQNGVFKHSVEQGDLDVRSIVTFILDSYYTNVPAAIGRPVLNEKKV